MSVAFIVIIIYMALLVFISWVSAAFQKGKDSDGFLLADRQLPWPLVGVMVAGIAVGGSSTVGVAQNAYTMGMSAGWYNTAWAVGPIFVGLFVVTNMRKSGIATVNGMAGRLFGTRYAFVSMLIQVIVMTVIVSLQIVAGGAILAAILPNMFSMTTGLIVSGAMFGLVAVVGGLLAASLSNVLNLTMIYAGVILGIIVAVNQYGGMTEIAQALPMGLSGDGSHWFHPTSGIGLSVILAWVLTMTLQGVANGGVLQNFIAAKTPQDARKGAFFGAALMIPCGFLTAFLGIIAASHLPGLENSAMALPSIVMTLPGWVAGILLAGLWAADISTATGLMVAISTMICSDGLFKYVVRTKNRRTRLLTSRLVILAIVVVATVAAMNVASILGALMAALALFVPFGVVITVAFVAPRFLKQASGWVTFIGGASAFVLAQLIEPSLRLGGQTVYTVFLVSLVFFALSQFDKRPAPVARLYMSEAELEADVSQKDGINPCVDCD